jgi:tRNA A37 threonylcarbamoyladenosine dehydratase
MGAGGKMDGLNIKIADISETYNCKLAKMLRKRIHKIGIHKGFKVVFSPELIDPSKVVITPGEFHKKSNVGTISYMPALFGIQCASHVLNELTEGPVQASLPRSSYPDPMEDQKQD